MSYDVAEKSIVYRVFGSATSGDTSTIAIVKTREEAELLVSQNPTYLAVAVPMYEGVTPVSQYWWCRVQLDPVQVLWVQPEGSGTWAAKCQGDQYYESFNNEAFVQFYTEGDTEDKARTNAIAKAHRILTNILTTHNRNFPTPPGV